MLLHWFCSKHTCITQRGKICRVTGLIGTLAGFGKIEKLLEVCLLNVKQILQQEPLTKVQS